MIEAVETAIIAALENEFGKDKGFAIESFPADFDKYRFTAAEGCHLVRYDASSFSKPNTVHAVCQDETLEFSIISGFRYLAKYSDAYALLKRIKNCLTGLKINGQKLYPKKREYIDKVNGDIYWGYVFNITLSTSENIVYEPDNLITMFPPQQA